MTVNVREPTAFERRVYAALLEVPRGRVTTYKALAQRVGCGSCRAVAQALRRNPDAPRVPCHRVIASDGTLGGYQGASSGAAVERKRRLLAAEGVVFERGRLATAGALYDWGRGRKDVPRGPGLMPKNSASERAMS
jgi:methylated-DNA-[protein]-cysteine S-methyltransferase